MSIHDAERDPGGRRRDEAGGGVGEERRPDEEPRPTGGETPREDGPELDETAGENPS